MKDRRKRLGCGKGGHKEVQKHKFLKGVDWRAVLAGQAQVPYLLPVDEQTDSGNFHDYPDSFEDDAIPLNGGDREVFRQLDNF